MTLVANDKADNEMIPGAVHRSPGICLTAEENLGKTHLGDRLMKGYATSHPVKWGPFPPNEVDRIALNVKTVERKSKGGTGIVNIANFKICRSVRITVIRCVSLK